jgi:MazG family protein
MKEFDELVALMDRLRDDGGCPWDREQTPKDLRGYLLEEAHEVVDAIDEGTPAPLREELGDLLFQIVFLARIHQERGDFTIRDVAREIAEKMTRRHPHVFGDSTAGSSAEVLRQWEDIKRLEKEAKKAKEPGGAGAASSALDGVPRSLPALLRAERLGTRASRAGFDWTRPREVLEKVEEEVAELRRAVDSEGETRVAEEFGDVLFALANLARHLGVHSEGALQEASDRFGRRYRWIEEELRRRGSDPSKETPAELERLWQAAKKV